MIIKIVEFIVLILSIPFRLKCKNIGKSVRIAPFYSIFGCHIENIIIKNKVNIGSNAWMQTVPTTENSKPLIIIGENTNIGRNVVISAAKKISIGENCLISYGISLLDHNHEFKNINVPPLFQGIDKPEEILIGKDCLIGAHTFILKGVVLGEHCVVGANSVVCSSFPPYSVIAGSPARKIRELKN
jgi:acetyltransferase-like isoleucine patch superfamily enzyme